MLWFRSVYLFCDVLSVNYYVKQIKAKFEVMLGKFFYIINLDRILIVKSNSKVSNPIFHHLEQAVNRDSIKLNHI